MNKKIFIIVGAVIIALIFLVLIFIVIVDNKNPSKEVTFSMNSNTVNTTTKPEETDPTPTPTQGNETEDPRDPIEGEIQYIETEDGGVIPVPPTFTYAGGESRYGAVIEDKNGNEFVWVPVEDYNSYNRQLFANNGEENEDNNNREEETLETLKLRDINSYNNDYDDSIKNYKGFYIARFEAGKEKISGENYAVSKPNVVPWTQISWEGAKEASEKMFIENDYFQTDLVNSYAWDTICNWLRDTGINIDNSVEYGNYQNSPNGLNRVVETASNDRWQTNNIYDLAGNAWEYTTEESGDHDRYHVGRGGGYSNEGDRYPISARAITGDTPNLTVAFRVVMYLK